MGKSRRKEKEESYRKGERLRSVIGEVEFRERLACHVIEGKVKRVDVINRCVRNGMKRGHLFEKQRGREGGFYLVAWGRGDVEAGSDELHGGNVRERRYFGHEREERYFFGCFCGPGCKI